MCEARFKKEGGRARCCYCHPHEGCELTKQEPDKYIVPKKYDPRDLWQKKMDPVLNKMVNLALDKEYLMRNPPILSKSVKIKKTK